MTKQPLVSIIIPAFNRAHLIGDTLDSVLAQTYPYWECLVVDDGSTDETESLLQAYIKRDSRFQYHKRPDTYLPGGNGARNYGFEISKGEYIQWFDDDDVMLKDFIQAKYNLFKKNIKLTICEGTLVNTILEEPMPISVKIQDYIFKDYLFWKAQILTPSVLFKKDFLKNSNLFKENLKKGQETEFFSRLFYNLEEDSYAVLNKPLFLYRYHENSKTTKNEVYINTFKESIAYTYVENLKRAIRLKDKELIRFNYKPLMRLFYDAYTYKHTKNRKYISMEITRIFVRKLKYIDVVLLLNAMTFFDLNSYKLYGYLKKRQITF